MSSPATQELQDFYDRKIDGHFSEIRLLREQRNADCSKTKNLPPEILVMIFGFLECEFRGETHSHLEWNSVTQVCRTWRNAALNEPTLWIDFIEPHPKWIRELFARSQAALLILRFEPDAQDGLDFIIDHVVEHPERMKSLDICTKGPFPGLFNKPAPFLQALVTRDDVEFPSDFLGGVAPRLESLFSSGALPLEASWLASVTNLECRRLPLGATWFRQLTSLHLGWGWVALDAKSGKIRRPSMEIILSALDNMPLLQRLDIYLSYNMNKTPCIRSTPVHLRHLCDITARFSHAPMTTIFNYLAVDSIKQLRTNWPSSSETANVNPVLQFFNRCYEGGDLHYLSQTTGVEMGRFVGSKGEYVPVLVLEDFKPVDLASIVNQVPCCVPRLFETYLAYAFKTLSLKECETIEQLRVCRPPELDDVLEFDDTSPPPYPSLRRIHFVGINFSPKRRVIPSIKRWLAIRDSKIELEMSDCNISGKAIELLRKMAFITNYYEVPGTIES